RQARHLAQSADDGEVPAGDEEVLLRSGEVQELPGAAGHQIPDGPPVAPWSVRPIGPQRGLGVGWVGPMGPLPTQPMGPSVLPTSVTLDLQAQGEFMRSATSLAVIAAATLLAAAPARAAGGTTAPTFSKDVAPILYKSCVECHRPTMFAPMSL